MNVRDPLMDPRGYDAIVAETEALVRAELAAVQIVWDRPAGRPDMAFALLHIFARMVQHVIDNVNQVPNQQFLAFLNLIGAQRTPPRPARAPLTFQFAADAPSDAIVPPGTRVASPPIEGEEAEVVFETERELVVSRARLAAIVVHRPDLDRYNDRSPASEEECPILGAEAPLEHSIFIDGGDLFTLPEDAALTVDIGLPAIAPSTWDELPLSWASWDGAAFQPLSVSSAVALAGAERRQIITFSLSAPVPLGVIGGREGRFLRATLTTPLPSAEADKVPAIHDVEVKASLTRGGRPADAAFTGTIPVDLSLDFHPFGEQPKIGDAFFVTSNEVLGKAGAVITLTFTKSQAALPPRSTDDPVLTWEVWTTGGWLEVGRSSRAHASLKPTALSQPDVPYTSVDPSPHAFDDATFALTVFDAEGKGEVTLTLPGALAPHAERGVTGYFLRVRIAKGTKVYGAGITLVTQTIQLSGPNNAPVDVPVSVPVDDGYRPPVIASLALSYTYTKAAPAPGVVTRNDFVDVDRTEDNRLAISFLPFTHEEGDGPAIYLGFDPPFANRSASLFFEIASPSALDVAASSALTLASVLDAPVFTWEYASAQGGYARLGAEDETNGFRRTGIVRFIGPADLTRRSSFGKSLYWLRARLIRGEFTVNPLLRCVHTNTVWAYQAVTIAEEVLGSSNGAPEQTFLLSQRPVLPGQRIEVLERATPSSAERAAIERAVGGDALQPVIDEEGGASGVWVRWREVSDFHASGPNDRHYLLDRATGRISFGDGDRGFVPPSGEANVRAGLYRAGGGQRGNRAKETINQLKTTVAYIQGVNNYVPASGGTDLGTLAELKDLGPRTLRHGHAPITAEDYEDLAKEASSDVARARCVTPHFDPVAQESPTQSLPAGSVLVIVVPFGDGPRPVPPLSLLEDVREALVTRCPPAVSLRVAGPDWVRITVHVTLAPRSIEASDELSARVRAAIERYLHPLQGGAEGRGWEFGSLPQTSDMYPILTPIEGIDHIRSLSLSYERESAPSAWAPLPSDVPADVMSRVLVFSGSHAITIYAGGA